MKSKYIKIIIELSIVIGFLLIAVLVFDLKEKYSSKEEPLLYTSKWTKAICNEDNYCIDMVITCNSTNVINIEPIGELVFMGSNWIDPREQIKWC